MCPHKLHITGVSCGGVILILVGHLIVALYVIVETAGDTNRVKSGTFGRSAKLGQRL